MKFNYENWHEKSPKLLWFRTFLLRYLNRFALLAAEEGFEPSQTESESAVLPLHNSAIYRRVFPTAGVIVSRSSWIVKGFLEFF